MPVQLAFWEKSLKMKLLAQWIYIFKMLTHMARLPVRKTVPIYSPAVVPRAQGNSF